MKKLFLPLLLFFAFSGCKEDADPVAIVIGQWDLISIEGGWGGPILSGSEMTYQQTYQFNADGTFIKTQEAEDQTEVASGTYLTERGEVASSADVKLNVLLDFTDGEELAGTCVLGSELLVLRHNNQLINTWSWCDGPRLTYDKK